MRLIDADALKDYVMDVYGRGTDDNTAIWYGDVLSFINEAPTIDAVPVVHGRWLPVDEKNDAFDCSECDIMVQKRLNYCPNCGAKMDEEG